MSRWGSSDVYVRFSERIVFVEHLKDLLKEKVCILLESLNLYSENNSVVLNFVL